MFFNDNKKESVFPWENKNKPLFGLGSTRKNPAPQKTERYEERDWEDAWFDNHGDFDKNEW